MAGLNDVSSERFERIGKKARGVTWIELIVA